MSVCLLVAAVEGNWAVDFVSEDIKAGKFAVGTVMPLQVTHSSSISSNHNVTRYDWRFEQRLNAYEGAYAKLLTISSYQPGHNHRETMKQAVNAQSVQLDLDPLLSNLASTLNPSSDERLIACASAGNAALDLHAKVIPKGSSHPRGRV